MSHEICFITFFDSFIVFIITKHLNLTLLFRTHISSDKFLRVLQLSNLFKLTIN